MVDIPGLKAMFLEQSFGERMCIAMVHIPGSKAILVEQSDKMDVSGHWGFSHLSTCKVNSSIWWTAKVFLATGDKMVFEAQRIWKAISC